MAVTITEYPVTVDYSLSLEEMVEAGKYDWLDEDITAGRFPIRGNGQTKTTILLLHFVNRDMKMDEVIFRMEQRGFQPAKIEHLLALGAKHSDLQLEHMIIALGSLWMDEDGSPLLPYIGLLGKSERCLGLYYFECGFANDYSLAAVRKIG